MARYSGPKAERGSGRAEVLRGFELHGKLVRAGTYIPTADLGDLLASLIARGAIRMEGQSGAVEASAIEEAPLIPIWETRTQYVPLNGTTDEDFNG